MTVSLNSLLVWLKVIIQFTIHIIEFFMFWYRLMKSMQFLSCDFTKFWGFYKSLPDVLYKQQHSEYQLLKVVWPFSFAISLRMVMIYWKRLRKVLDVLRHHHWSIKIFQVFRNLQKPDQTSKIRFYTIWTMNLDSKFVIEIRVFVVCLHSFNSVSILSQSI